MRKLDDDIFYKEDAQEKIAEVMRGLLPFVSACHSDTCPSSHSKASLT